MEAGEAEMGGKLPGLQATEAWLCGGRSLDTGTPSAAARSEQDHLSAVPPLPPPSPGFWGERDAYKDVNPGAWTSGGQLLLCLWCLGRASGLQPVWAAVTGLGFNAVLLRVLSRDTVVPLRVFAQTGPPSPGRISSTTTICP